MEKWSDIVKRLDITDFDYYFGFISDEDMNIIVDASDDSVKDIVKKRLSYAISKYISIVLDDSMVNMFGLESIINNINSLFRLKILIKYEYIIDCDYRQRYFYCVNKIMEDFKSNNRFELKDLRLWQLLLIRNEHFIEGIDITEEVESFYKKYYMMYEESYMYYLNSVIYRDCSKKSKPLSEHFLPIKCCFDSVPKYLKPYLDPLEYIKFMYSYLGINILGMANRDYYYVDIPDGTSIISCDKYNNSFCLATIEGEVLLRYTCKDDSFILSFPSTCDSKQYDIYMNYKNRGR